MKFNIKKLALVAGALAGLMSVTAFAGSSSGGASAAGMGSYGTINRLTVKKWAIQTREGPEVQAPAEEPAETTQEGNK